jgi:hypothetical protein
LGMEMVGGFADRIRISMPVHALLAVLHVCTSLEDRTKREAKEERCVCDRNDRTGMGT